MGMVFGKISVETPKFEVVKKTRDYEIRKYLPCVMAEVTYSPKEFNNNKDGGFRVLAEYIGAFGKPNNLPPQNIPMTAPVLTSSLPHKVNTTSPETIAMTAPVVTSSDQEMVTMAFILPSKYTKVEDAPKPVDERVKLREEGEKKYGVVTFGGTTTNEIVAEKVDGLKKVLEKDGFKVVGDYKLARFNPPWTLPPFKTNEVMLPVE